MSLDSKVVAYTDKLLKEVGEFRRAVDKPLVPLANLNRVVYVGGVTSMNLQIFRPALVEMLSPCFLNLM